MSEPTTNEMLAELDAFTTGTPAPPRDHSDDASSGYLSRRTDAATDAMLAELDAFAAQSERPARVFKSVPPDSAPVEEEDDTPAAVRVAKDIGTGLYETPRAIAHGAIDAVNETADLVSGLAGWITEKAGLAELPGLRVSAKGVEVISAEELNANRLADARVPNFDAPESVTGGIVEGAAQFLTGFAAAGKLLKLAPATKAGQVAAAAAKGAVADFSAFDPHEARLSNLIQSQPALRNPVTAYLAADPDDGEAEGRFKNALEGLGMGVLTEGVARGIKALRAAREARIASRAADFLEYKPDAIDLRLLGDAKVDDVVIVREADDAAAKLADGAEATAGTPPGDVLAPPEPPVNVEINFARIDTPEDIHQTIQTLADLHAGSIDDARRGVRTWEQTELSAAQVDAWSTLMARRQGDALNAEQAVAARELWATSATKLRDVASVAAAAPNETNLVMFRKMLATHYAIQKEVIAARTETARALNAWKIPVKPNRISVNLHLSRLLEENGGAKVSRELAQRVAALAQAGMTRELETVVEQGIYARTSGAVAQAWINGLLTNPATHVVNTMSSLSTSALSVMERRVAGHLSRLMGAENGVEVGEAAHLMFGMVEGIKDALRISAKGRDVLAGAGRMLLSGEVSGAKRALANASDEFGSVYRAAATGRSGYGMGKVDTRAAGGALSAEAWRVSGDTWIGRGLDLLDGVTSTPTRALGTMDELFKTMGYRAELHARALRQATADVRDGLVPRDGLKARIAELVREPPEDLKLAAIDAATYNTFTGAPAKTLKKLADGVQQLPILGRLLLPFKNTPINVMTYAFERTPFAPMIATWRADIAAGGARADLALARMGLGSMVLLAGVDMAINGTITGKSPKQPSERQHFNRSGKQAYSIKVGDRWYSYSRLDPIGMTLGLAADVGEFITHADPEDADLEHVIQAATLAIASNVTSKTYMSGAAAMFDAVSDPDRYGEAWFQKLAGSLVPAGVAAITRTRDPYLRAADDMIDALRRRTPGLSDDLPPLRDLWGRPVSLASGEGAMYDLFSPVYIKRENPEPIDEELARLEYYPAMPKRSISLNGVSIRLTSEQYSRYVELAGNEAKDVAFGVGAREFLNGIVQGTHPLAPVYQMMDDEQRENFIEGKLVDYRRLARDQLVREFPGLIAEYDRRRVAGGNCGTYSPVQTNASFAR